MLNKLKGHIPDKVYNELSSIKELTNAFRIAHFLGQAAHESGNFTAVRENLNYSAQGLANTWPTRYAVNPKATPKVPNSTANSIARNPVLIANHTYANRMGNGDINSGDGNKYIGRGYIQLTGKSNYKAFGDAIGVDLVSTPDLIATTYPLASAAFFFTNNKLWTICDKGIDLPVVTTLTKRINGANIGLGERIKHTQSFYKILTS